MERKTTGWPIFADEDNPELIIARCLARQIDLHIQSRDKDCILVRGRQAEMDIFKRLIQTPECCFLQLIVFPYLNHADPQQTLLLTHWDDGIRKKAEVLYWQNQVRVDLQRWQNYPRYAESLRKEGNLKAASITENLAFYYRQKTFQITGRIQGQFRGVQSLTQQEVRRLLEELVVENLK